MTIRLRFAALAVAAMALVGCEAGADKVGLGDEHRWTGQRLDSGIRYILAAHRLKPEELDAQFAPGIALDMKWRGDNTGRLRLNADKTATLTIGDQSFDGNWRIAEGGYCTTFTAGDERCFFAYDRGGFYRIFTAPAGNYHADATPI